MLMSRHWISSCLALTLAGGAALALPPSEHARSLRGAAEILTEIRETLAERQGETPPRSGAERFQEDLDAFSRAARSMEPAEAAAGWLALHRRFLETPQQMLRGPGYQTLGYQQVLAALPPPEAWPALAAAVEALPGEGEEEVAERAVLRLLTGVLQGDEARLREVLLELRSFRARPGPLAGLAGGLRYVLQTLERSLGIQSSEVEEFRKKLERAKEQDAELGYLQVPVELAEEPEAVVRADLAEALRRAKRVTLPDHEGLRRMAREVAAANAEDLDEAPWYLAGQVGGLELFRVLEGRFPLPELDLATASDEEVDQFRAELSERRGTWLVNLLAAIAVGDVETRDRILGYYRQHHGGAGSSYRSRGSSALPERALDLVAGAGKQAELLEVLEALLRDRPELGFWDAYSDLGLSLGHEERVLRTLRGALEAASEARRGKVRDQLLRVLLAIGRLDEAEVLVREALGERDEDMLKGQAADWALKWLKVGHLTQDPKRESLGRAALVRYLKATEEHAPQDVLTAAIRLARGLATIEDPVEAESALARGIAAVQARGQGQASFGVSGGPARRGLVELAGLYHHEGRHEDVLVLLERSPHWGADDLVELLDERDHRKVPLVTMAGIAAAKSGREAAGRRILEAALLRYPGHDEAYRAYTELLGDGARPYLDFLRRRDILEERPLIWRATLEKEAGELEAAEETLRMAIAIDPSDGEQGPGDRMRAYAVLAEVLAARGEQEKAALYRRAVRAIRTAEEADRFYEAGLVRESLARYEKALALFSDAYCVRSRLALRYAELGALSQARVHYRRAFELMPSSFGFRESHCFGCEGVFRGPLAQSIAEEVFTQARSESEAPPQVAYLLGYLRNTQQRKDEAQEAFLEAARQSPDYFNAWSKLNGLGAGASLAPEVRRDASRHLVRLDPAKRHHHGGYGGLGLADLWAEVRAAAEYSRPEPEELLPLSTSAERQALLATLQGSQAQGGAGRGQGFGSSVFEVPSPGEVLAQHQVLQALGGVGMQLQMLRR